MILTAQSLPEAMNSPMNYWEFLISSHVLFPLLVAIGLAIVIFVLPLMATGAVSRFLTIATFLSTFIIGSLLHWGSVIEEQREDAALTSIQENLYMSEVSVLDVYDKSGDYHMTIAFYQEDSPYKYEITMAYNDLHEVMVPLIRDGYEAPPVIEGSYLEEILMPDFIEEEEVAAEEEEEVTVE